MSFSLPGIFYDDRWTHIDADTVGDASPTILFATTFAPFFLARQVFMEVATLVLVLINMEVNSFVTDRDVLFGEQTA